MRLTNGCITEDSVYIQCSLRREQIHNGFHQLYLDTLIKQDIATYVCFVVRKTHPHTTTFRHQTHLVRLCCVTSGPSTPPPPPVHSPFSPLVRPSMPTLWRMSSSAWARCAACPTETRKSTKQKIKRRRNHLHDCFTFSLMESCCHGRSLAPVDPNFEPLY